MSAFKPDIPAGTGVAIVAPGGYAPDETALARGIALLEQWGCRVFNYYQPEKKYQRFGGTDYERVTQLHDAASNPDVKIVLALRGGYGMTRILPLLNRDLLAKSGKLFVGHSDFTALQMAMLNHSHAVTFAGPMMCDDFNREHPSDFTLRHFWECLTRPDHALEWAAQGNPEIDVSGTLWGGNLAMLTSLLGSMHTFPAVDFGILFVEDINEHPYRIERMLLQLQHAGVLGRQAAVVLGDFSGYRLSDYDNGYDFAAMLDFLRSTLTVPVLTGLQFGHIRDKVTLPVGAKAHLVSNGTAVRLSFSGYPTL